MKRRAMVAVLAMVFLLGTKPVFGEGNPLPYPPPEPGPPWWCVFMLPTYPGCVLPVV
jgi:hypothetical protein